LLTPFGCAFSSEPKRQTQNSAKNRPLSIVQQAKKNKQRITKPKNRERGRDREHALGYVEFGFVFDPVRCWKPYNLNEIFFIFLFFLRLSQWSEGMPC
jgi:hypothetical protein